MKILALDSSGLVASVAVLEEDNLVAEYTIQYKKTHSQTLLPMLDEISRMIELDLSTLDAIAVAAGPGSFTGLRIGCATAKGLGQALGKPLVGIPTVDGLAYNLYGCEKLICPLMDARRNQTYTGLYEFKKEAAGYDLTESDKHYITLFYSHAIIGNTLEWIEKGLPPSRDDLMHRLSVSFQATIRDMIESCIKDQKSDK